jgi:hypothetical protein
MTQSDKLEAILACVQTDPGNRGLARDPEDNLFTATAGDFERACRSVASRPDAHLSLLTGFFIPTSSPPAYETDGPLGCVFLMRSLVHIIPELSVGSPHWDCSQAMRCGLERVVRDESGLFEIEEFTGGHYCDLHIRSRRPATRFAHVVSVEHPGRATDGKYYSMRGRDLSEHVQDADRSFLCKREHVTIGIGDGGNEIGMGKIPHETIVKNIPNGDLIHCRVPTDYLIVAGVSNWGAYALAAGVYVLRNEKPPANLFDPDYERKILEIMVDAGPLVDGVTGKQEATVDGLSWDEYVKPLIHMREILEC